MICWIAISLSINFCLLTTIICDYETRGYEKPDTETGYDLEIGYCQIKPSTVEYRLGLDLPEKLLRNRYVNKSLATYLLLDCYSNGNHTPYSLAYCYNGGINSNPGIRGSAHIYAKIIAVAYADIHRKFQYEKRK